MRILNIVVLLKAKHLCSCEKFLAIIIVKLIKRKEMDEREEV